MKNLVFIKVFLMLFSTLRVYSCGSIISDEVTLGAEKTLNKWFPKKQLGHIDLWSCYWTQSGFQKKCYYDGESRNI